MQFENDGSFKLGPLLKLFRKQDVLFVPQITWVIEGQEMEQFQGLQKGEYMKRKQYPLVLSCQQGQKISVTIDIEKETQVFDGFGGIVITLESLPASMKSIDFTWSAFIEEIKCASNGNYCTLGVGDSEGYPAFSSKKASKLDKMTVLFSVV